MLEGVSESRQVIAMKVELIGRRRKRKEGVTYVSMKVGTSSNVWRCEV